MRVIIDVPDKETLIGWYTRFDGINQYHNAKTLGNQNYKPLEQMLGQIRTEIEQIANEEQKHDEKWSLGLRYAVKIIDNYKSESEESK